MDGVCEVCGCPAECEHHLIFGQALRRLADEDDLTIKMCHRCHNMSRMVDCKIHDNPMAEKLSKMLGQLLWEKRYIEDAYEAVTGETIKKEAHREFMNRYGRSYIDGI